VRVIWRRDRYLRGSDHLSFQSHGYPAARFTEPRENFNHEHQDVRVDGGVQFGDLPQFVDFDYTARVAKVNGAALWALATNPSTPKNLQIHTAPPTGFPGTNLTALNWDANPEPDLAGYQVVMRDRRWLIAFGAESAGWLMYVAALRLAPLALVQAVAASGVVVLAFRTARGHPSRLARREQVAVVLAVAGLVLLALSLVDTSESDQHPTAIGI